MRQNDPLPVLDRAKNSSPLRGKEVVAPLLMKNYEYMRIKLADIPQEIIDKYNLPLLVHNGWVYIEIHRGAYGLPQADVLACNKLTTVLNDARYYEAATTLGLWSHRWQSIIFTLVIDDFGFKYAGKQYIEHLMNTLKTHCDLTAD